MREQVLAELAELGPLKGLGDEVREYPLQLLQLVINLHAQRGGPVPDHLMKLPAYLGETALRALEEGGFLESAEDPLYAIRAYVPTAAGEALSRKAAAETSGTVPSRSRKKRG